MISPISVVLLFGSGRGGAGWDQQSPELFPEFPAYAEHFIVFSNTPSPFTQTGIWHTRLEKESRGKKKKGKQEKKKKHNTRKNPANKILSWKISIHPPDNKKGLRLGK